ncbi:M20 family metallo-hydrolase [Sunxiuqinia elliptica]|uniref:Acetylornithine deacetylase n=1 Tax=Sunxiuqinia elliptica TaxID=655355 RepID=A0A4R6HAB0_9BACT|nr:M20 family metallo-hydrolase [Sunxiuqinia elliptica]TDO05302.1 acetylornithine deacetylase [Sunxiuqinia elliptica]TDO64851.1 acetylornithine deacetylase [Sunxiuqinia elliptica]
MDAYIELLKQLIQTQSFSKEEEPAAELVRNVLRSHNIPFETKKNNTWARNQNWQEGLPVVLLNSHVDTVRPGKNWTKDPFGALLEGDYLYGLGSNDAGASLVTLLAVFIHFNSQDKLPYNLIYAASAEEEISGPNGMESLIEELGAIDLVIVGEPTQMQMAIAEKGLMVLDCVAHGKTGHAARNEGENALYKGIEDIQKLRDYQFEKTSEVLGEVKLSITQINAGYQHNVVPDQCSFVVDVRTNEHYSNQKAFEIIDSLIGSEVKARSFRLNSSGIELDHPIVKRGMDLGLTYYGSPTTSDQAVMPFRSIKIGPGDSARSHTADEYILISELKEGFKTYVSLLDGLRLG